MIKLYHILFLLVTVGVFAQGKVKGITVHDSIPIANVHIYNKTTYKGVISNSNGMFEITANINDILHISAMPYRNVVIKIDRKILEKPQLVVNMQQQVTTLNEVVIDNRKALSGSLFIDREKVPKDFLKTTKIDLQRNKIDFTPYAEVNTAEDRGLDEVYNANNFAKIDVLKVIKFISKKWTKRSKAKKKEKLFAKNLPIKIREELGDDFFIKSLHIPKPYIEDFINTVTTNEFLQLYKQNKKIQWIDMIVQKSYLYKP